MKQKNDYLDRSPETTVDHGLVRARNLQSKYMQRSLSGLVRDGQAKLSQGKRVITDKIPNPDKPASA